MNRSVIICGLILSLFLAGCSGKSKDTGPAPEIPVVTSTDQERIQGTWKLEGSERNGKIEKDESTVVYWTFDGRRLLLKEVRVGIIDDLQSDTEAIPFELDETKSLKTLKFDVLGIYELNGDRLKIGIGDQLPTSFDTNGANSNVTVLHFKRDKNAKPVTVDPDADFTKFPKSVIGKWHCNSHATEFPLYIDVEFTKDGKVLLETRENKWEEKFKYHFEKDELILTMLDTPKPLDKAIQRIKIKDINETRFIAKSPSGKMTRVK